MFAGLLFYTLLCFRCFLWRTVPFPTPVVVVPSIDAPVVDLVAAGPPALELPPAVLEGLCANANEVERAKAVANAMVFSFMDVSLWLFETFSPPVFSAIEAAKPLA